MSLIVFVTAVMVVLASSQPAYVPLAVTLVGVGLVAFLDERRANPGAL